MAILNWKVSKVDAVLIGKIVKRFYDNFSHLAGSSARMTLNMDITACHLNGNRLRLADLLASEEQDFLHDIGGISRSIDRETGKLTDCFSPRYSAEKAVL